MVDDQYRCLLDEVVPELARLGRPAAPRLAETDPPRTGASERVLPSQRLPGADAAGGGPGAPFPYISNLSISLAVFLRGADGEERFARVKVPKILPRWVALPGPPRSCRWSS